MAIARISAPHIAEQRPRGSHRRFGAGFSGGVPAHIRYISASMRGGTWMAVLIGLVLSTGANAIVADSPDASQGSPYQGIPERNVFGLRQPAPPPVVNPEANKPPPPKLTLTGITTIMGNKRALMTAQLPARPPEPARAQHYMLTEGQREGDVEVLNIDEVKGTVSVNNHGVPQEIVFEKEIPRFPPAPGAPNPAGGIPTPTSGAGPAQPTTAAGLKTIPTRQLRLPTLPTDPQAAQLQQQQPQPQPQVQPGQEAQPVPPPVPLPQTPPYSAPQQPQPALTPEEQLILMEAERELRREQIRRGEIPPFPPSPVNPQ
jgi:hypothetical protein